MPTAPNALGNIVSLAGDVPEGSPPTSYAAYGLLKGEKGSVFSFASLTLLRSLIIAPGLAVAGIRGKHLFWGALAGSSFISLTALVYVAASERQKRLQNGGFVKPENYDVDVDIGEAEILNRPPIDTTGESL